jgi:hypothetical protein
MRRGFVRLRLGLVSALVVGGGLVAASLGQQAAASQIAAHSAVKAPVFTLSLTKVGEINLTKLSQSDRASAKSADTAKYHEVDNSILAHAPKGKPTSVPNPPTTTLSTTNVRGERGFNAMGGVQQADTVGGSDLEPPDQGLCAGGGYVMEFINNALAVYSGNGAQLVGPVGSATAFLQPTSDFFSDPRCYYDAPTKRWFFQEFTVLASSSTEFEAVSNTPDPTTTYTVYSWNTTDASASGCPCFGDYDEFGADDNGIYVTTDEFGISTPAYNGVVMYAISKEQIETASGTGIVPTVFAYRLTKDPFGQPYIVAPTTTPPGAKFATNTEYFVESNSNQESDSHLLVYALNDTSLLGQPAPPTLYRTEISTESYAFPPDAKQKPGPRPLGKAYQDPEGGIQADFNAEMEPTYVGGKIYAELDTATTSGSNAVDWFIIDPTLSNGSLSASLVHQGAVAVANTSLLYPYTALDSSGVGYLLFSLSGPDIYPSPAYIDYGSSGPTGSVIVATTGAAPEDGFTCYAAFVGPNYGGCRWGDYSMGVAMGNRVYMAAEMVPQGFRDTLTNWGTYIWSAPPPS